MSSAPEELDAAAIRAAAEAELREERRRHRIEAEKVRLRTRRWWHRLFPFRITIERRK